MTKCMISQTTPIAITNTDARVSTRPFIRLLLIFTSRSKVLLWWLLLMQILRIISISSTPITFVVMVFSSHFFLISFTKFSKYSNSLRMERIVSIGDNEFFLLMKWVRIFDLVEPSLRLSTSPYIIICCHIHHHHPLLTSSLAHH